MPVRLVDAITRVEPTWVEVVAIAQAVCAQLSPGQKAPALDSLSINPNGGVMFPPPGAGDEHAAVAAVGRLIAVLLGSGDCPMPLWELIEQARREPESVGNPAAYGRMLTCFPATLGPVELTRYYQAVRQAKPGKVRPAMAALAYPTSPLRTGLVMLAVMLGAVGVGVSMGIAVASRANRSTISKPAEPGERPRPPRTMHQLDRDSDAVSASSSRDLNG